MISNQDLPTRLAKMIKADTDIILVIHHLKSNLQFPVDCKHVYGHQDGKHKKKQDKQDKELEGENDELDYETEVESSISKAEEEMIEMFQLGEYEEAKGRKREIEGSQESRGKEKTDPGEKGGEERKG